MGTLYFIDGYNQGFESVEAVRNHIALWSEEEQRKHEGTDIYRVAKGESDGWTRTIRIKGSKVVFEKPKIYKAK